MKLNGRWFPSPDSRWVGTVGIYIQYILHSPFLIFDPGGGGGGGVKNNSYFISRVLLYPTFQKFFKKNNSFLFHVLCYFQH